MGCTQVESKKPMRASQTVTVTQKAESANPIKSKGANPSAKREEPKPIEVKEESKPVQKPTFNLDVNEPEMVKISIPVTNNKKWERDFPRDSLIKDIVEQYKKDMSGDFTGDNEIVWKCNDSPMNLDDKLDTLIPKDSQKIDLNIQYDIKGLPSVQSQIEDEVDRVAKPLSNPFEVFIFSKKEKMCQTVGFDEDVIQKNELNYYSGFSSYCNGCNKLYISGGQNQQEIPLGHFWTIDLNTKEVETHPTGMNPKKQHSMIYIPKQYVFIVGGNSEDTFYYDTESKSFVNWAPLNIKRVEPALAFVNNKYIYAFNNLRINQKNTVITFERTNLRGEPLWEVITPDYEEAMTHAFKQKFFSVCPIEKDRIIFLGGNMDNSEGEIEHPSYFIYDTKNNMVSQSLIPFKEFNFAEKNFFPLTENTWFNIPSFNRTTPKIVMFNKQSNRINDILFEPGAVTPDLVDENIDYDDGMMKNFKLSQSVMPKMTTKRYNYNMPKFNFADFQRDSPKAVPTVKANYQVNHSTIEVKDIPLVVEPIKFESPKLTPIDIQTNQIEEVNVKPATLKSKRVPTKPKEVESKEIAVQSVEVKSNPIQVEKPTIVQEQPVQTILPKKTIDFQKVDPSQELLERYNYQGKEDVDKADLAKSNEVIVEVPEPINVDVVKPELKGKAPVLKTKKPFVIGEEYISDNHQEDIPAVTFNKSKVELNNSGEVLRSSIIAKNRSMIKKSNLPSVYRSHAQGMNKITLSNNFDKSQIGDLKSSVNVGMAGKKNSSRIVQ